MTALKEAQEWKAVLERTLLQELKRFTDTSGLLVLDINVIQREVTSISDTHPKFVYGVELEIKV